MFSAWLNSLYINTVKTLEDVELKNYQLNTMSQISSDGFRQNAVQLNTTVLTVQYSTVFVEKLMDILQNVTSVQSTPRVLYNI